MCYVFPAILYRIESYLIALDATKLLGLDIGAALALEALTKDSDNTEEHGQIQLNLRRGMGNNYERLEFLGDCFLKLATSLSLFVMVPRESEFEYHVRRMCMLCNNNLFRVAQSLGLPEFVRSKSFSRCVKPAMNAQIVKLMLTLAQADMVPRGTQNVGRQRLKEAR
jgi:endoribonuclease Dicer